MKFRQIKPGPMRLGSLSVLGLVLLLCACGGGGNGSSSDTGSISFRLEWVHPGPQSGLAKSPSGDVCVDYLIDTVSVAVHNSSGTTILTQSWGCSSHQGTVDKVPKGSGYSLTVDGVVAGDVDWNNQTTGITVTGGQDTNIGKIEMAYIGDDQTRPAVSVHYPRDGDTGVFRNIVIAATFTEDVVAYSVETSSTLIEDGTSNPVSCDVVYNSSTNRVTLVPNGNLSQNTTYRVTIPKTVEDRAGLTMAADEIWTFKTSTVIGDLLVWDDRHWDESLWQAK